MGHLCFYNKNQIRDKLLLVLIFLQERYQNGKGVVFGKKQYYMLRNSEDAAVYVNITKYTQMAEH